MCSRTSGSNPPNFCFCDFLLFPSLRSFPAFTYNPFDAVAGISEVTSGVGSTRHMDQNIKTSYGENFFFGVERQIAQDTVLKVHDVGTGGVSSIR